MIAVVVIMTIVAIMVMAANDHDWSSMTAGISVVVSVSELNRYAALFCDHRWPIVPIRSRKRSTCQEEDCGSGKNQIFHRMLLRPVC
jgi:hypothetical protein